MIRSSPSNFSGSRKSVVFFADHVKRILSQQRRLIFKRDRNRSSSGKFFIQMFPRLRRLFYMRIRIDSK
jgi:hypothetical protein